MHMLARSDNSIRVVPRRNNGEIPLETVLEVLRSVSHGVIWPHIDGAALLRAVIHHIERATIGTPVDQIRIVRMGR